MKSLLAPKFTSPEVESFTKEEIEVLLKACDFCDEAGTDSREKIAMRRATARRDQAVILTLIDSSLRASELYSLRVADLDQKTGKITIRHGVNGGAKGGKTRFVYLGKTARNAVWRYLAEREDGENAEALLLLGKSGYPLLGFAASGYPCDWRKGEHSTCLSPPVQTQLRHPISSVWRRCFTLINLLRHNSLEMVQHYAWIVDVDVQEAHRKASLAYNWRL